MGLIADRLPISVSSIVLTVVAFFLVELLVKVEDQFLLICGLEREEILKL